MKIMIAALLAALASSLVHAETKLAMYSDHDIDAPLKAWMKSDSSVQSKVKSMAKGTRGFNNEDMSDLKDALIAQADPNKLPEAVAKVNGSHKRRLMERLPGMQTEAFASCHTLNGCIEAPISFHVDDASQIVDAAAALARPWVLLQKARGQSLSFEAALESNGRLLNFMMEDKPELLMSVDAHHSKKEGGFDVTLRGPSDPAALFERERQNALATLARR